MKIITKLKSSDLLSLTLSLFSIGFLILIGALVLICVQFLKFNGLIDSKIASELGGFLAGFVGVFWTGAGALLIYSTFKKQQEFNENQQFESSFFKLLDNYNNIVNTTRGEVKVLKNRSWEKNTYSGREYYSMVLQCMKDGLDCDDFQKNISEKEDIPEVKKVSKKIDEDFSDSDLRPTIKDELFGVIYLIKAKKDTLSKQFIIELYEYTYCQHKHNLGHYFRLLFNLFKFIIDNKKSEQERRKYLDIIQAQMSTDELGLLFYNALAKRGISADGERRFLNWLDHYQFLENIDDNSLFSRSHHEYYPNTKFKFLSLEEQNKKN